MVVCAGRGCQSGWRYIIRTLKTAVPVEMAAYALTSPMYLTNFDLDSLKLTYLPGIGY